MVRTARRRAGSRPRGRRPWAELDDALYAWVFSHEERGIVTTDLQLRVRHWNPWMASHSGKPESDVVGRPLLKIYPELEQKLGAWYRGALTGQVFVLSQRIHGHLFPMPTGAGTGACMPQSGRVAPLYREGKVAGTITLVQDVSERLSREEELRRLNETLEQTVAERTRALAASNKELEVMMYTVAHDLRAPLRTIRSYSQLVMRDAALDERARSHMQRVDAAMQSMTQMIDDLLDAVRLTHQPLKHETCDLSAMALSILADLAQQDPKRRVRTAVAPGLVVQGDPDLLRRMLENLLGNAWKFTRDASPPRIEFGAQGDAPRVYFVRDNGAGFDMAHGAQLFGLFTRLHAKSDFPGSGIGLAVVQRVVARHGGRVWAKGEVSHGATFYFTLQENPAPAGGR